MYYPDWEYIEIGIKPDHINLYMVIPPKYAVSMVTETIKKNTSRSLKQKVQLPAQGLLGPKRNLGKRILCLNRRNQ